MILMAFLICKITDITKVCLEKGWNSKQMITEGEAAILLETTRRAFRNQEKSKQRSAITLQTNSQLSDNYYHQS